MSKSFQKFHKLLIPTRIPSHKFDCELGTQGPSGGELESPKHKIEHWRESLDFFVYKSTGVH